MGWIFLGYLLIYFDLKFNRMELLPDIVGFVFIYFGLKSLADRSEYFKKAMRLVEFGIVLEILLMLANIEGITNKIIFWVLGLASLIISLEIIKNIALGVADLEAVHPANLQAKNIMDTWKVMVFADTINYIINVLANILSEKILYLAIPTILVGFFAHTMYLVFLYKSGKELQKIDRALIR